MGNQREEMENNLNFNFNAGKLLKVGNQRQEMETNLNLNLKGWDKKLGKLRCGEAKEFEFEVY